MQITTNRLSRDLIISSMLHRYAIVGRSPIDYATHCTEKRFICMSTIVRVKILTPHKPIVSNKRCFDLVKFLVSISTRISFGDHI